tara:strand:+ start:78 stop:278 length:201 start_codon:yes stop_codon:yes gene_type:complete
VDPAENVLLVLDFTTDYRHVITTGIVCKCMKNKIAEAGGNGGNRLRERVNRHVHGAAPYTKGLPFR